MALAAPRLLIAIGGITAARLPDLREAGAAGIAVISVVAAAVAPLAATHELVAGFAGEHGQGSDLLGDPGGADDPGRIGGIR